MSNFVFLSVIIFKYNIMTIAGRNVELKFG